MSVSDALGYVIIGLCAVQAAVRVPAVWSGRRRERSLGAAFACFAAVWWLRTGTGHRVLAPLGVEDLPSLLKYVLALGGICALLAYVTDVYRDADADVRHVRITNAVQRAAARASLATVLCMTGVFFVALDRSQTSADSVYFVGRHAGSPALLLFLGLFNIYTAAAAAVCAYQWGRAARLARRWGLRTGLVMMAAGMALMVLYAVLRTAYVAAVTVRPSTAAVGTVQEHAAGTVMYAAFLLWLLGSVAPASNALAGRIRAVRALVVLHPLWRDLVTAIDGVALHRPSRPVGGRRAGALVSVVRDVVAHEACAQIRLGRFVTEIRDASYELRRRAPADLARRARRLAAAEGHGEEAEAVAEAYWLMAALAAADAPPGAPVAFPTAGSEDFASEAVWLCRVARAYRAAGPRTATALDTLGPALSRAA
ncbi:MULTISPECIES: MAB_1171c family putative transporter [unclassified Streptomyces]|uniref:MAB_1171c family putative transporter n=1 Tax=unclassified Streptomyces TaxID=2593676 RepID=UPI003634CF7D